ncbi:MAG: hypothetical protein ACEQSB_04225 [Undibacterium sp.]
MRVLYLLTLALLGPLTAFAQTVVDDAYYERVLEEEAAVFADCETLTTARAMCERIKAARFRAKYTDLKTFEHIEGKRRIPYREFVLVTYDPETDTYRDLVLGMPVDVTKTPNFQPIIRSSDDADCQVVRLRGQSLNKMVFRVTCAGRELQAYAAKHLLFTEVKLSPLWSRREQTVQRIEEVVYLEVSPYFVNDESARAGQAVFMQLIGQAFDELRERRVPSRSSPGHLVAEAIALDSVANLLVTEQTDPCFRQNRPRGCDALIPVRPYANDAEVMRAVNTMFFLNGGISYRYMRSGAAAGGALQFTNNRTKRYIGTYNNILKHYPEARLDPDFWQGTRSIRNLAKAAACLIDLERAGLPNWAREAYGRDPEFGLPILGAAYNGGAKQASITARLIETFAKKRGIDEELFLFHLFPWDEFLAWIDQTGHKLVPETRVYIQKVIDATRHLYRHRPIMPAVNFEGDLG